jgi:YVTN family beta-propeller protein
MARFRGIETFGWLVAALTALGLGAACGSDDMGSNDAAGIGGTFSGDGSGTGTGGGLNVPAADAGTVGELPPETEVKVDFELPHAGEHFVYVANPESDTVAVINAETLAIETVEAGDEPTFLQTLAGTDRAIVLNVGSSDATIIRTDAAGSRASRVEVLPGSNAIAVAPDGKHAVAYYDATFRSAASRTGSFQDVTVITLADEGDSSVGMTVGFRPSDVFFSSDGARAFVVTEDGVSILNFTEIATSGPSIAATVPLAPTTLSKTLDVSITPDGQYALARAQNETLLRLVDLNTRVQKTLDLAQFIDSAPDTGAAGAAGAFSAGGAGSGESTELGPITDVDLAPNGEFALAVLRSQSAVLRIPVPAAFDDAGSVAPMIIDAEIVGSVAISPDSTRALLYTTALASYERLTVLNLTDQTRRSLDLRKAVIGVTVAPNGQTAFVVHRKREGDPNQAGLDPDSVIDRSFGYSVIKLTDGFAKLQITDADVGPFTIVPDSSHLFVLFNGATLREVQRVNLESFLVDHIAIGGPPISLGAVPGTQKVFVGQEHPDGRITFIDWLTGNVASVTGFELNSRIRE